MAGTIIKGDNFFNTTLYEGNGTGQRVGRFVPFTDAVTINKSLIFNRENTGANDLPGDRPYLSRSMSNGDRKKFTFSYWMKNGRYSSATTASGGTNYKMGNPMWIMGTVGSNARVYGALGGDKDVGLQCLDDSGNNYLVRYITFDPTDTSQWFHIVYAVDTSQSSNDDKIKIYVNGQLLTDIASTSYSVFTVGTNDLPALNQSGHTFYLSNHVSSYYYDGYFAEMNYVDGTVYDASKFGQTDTSTGRWVPKAISSVTYGTNGFRLEFANSAGQTIGHDTSGNGNNFSINGISAATDLSTDTPTQNFATMGGKGPDNTTVQFKEGNNKLVMTAADTCQMSTLGLPNSGKWYWEVRFVTLGGYERIGIAANYAPTNQAPQHTGVAYDRPSTTNGIKMFDNDVGSAWDGAFSNGDIMNIAVDMDAKVFYIGQNGTFRNSANPANGTGGVSFAGTVLNGNGCIMHAASGMGNSGSTATHVYNFGNNPDFSGGITAAANTASSGPGAFKYTPPTDFLALCQDNFPTPGFGVSDFVWIKNRDATDAHQLYDSSRGPFKDVQSDTNNAEGNTANGLRKFLKKGFSVGPDDAHNTVGESYVGWNWVANGGTTAANTDGSGATLASTTQANQTAGFSIVTYTGNATAGAKVAHGLSQAPQWLWITSRSLTTGGKIYHHKNTAAPATDYLTINTTDATFDSAWLNDTAPDSSCFTIGGTGVATNNSGATYVAWCWHEVPGFSKFGSYTGNGNTDGPFIFLGFKPAWFLVKSTGSANWTLYDSTRDPDNPVGQGLFPNLTSADTLQTGGYVDFLSNGVKHREDGSALNGNGQAYVYMAFAECPFNGNGETAFATAR